MNNIYKNKLNSLKKYTVVDYPVDLFEIAHDHEIQVRFKFMDGNKSGSIQKIDDHYFISLNITHVDVRNRFTFAHELAHYFLHQDYISNGIVDDILYKSTLSNDIENEANNFAADILMPIDRVQKDADTYMDGNKMLSPLFINPEAKVREMVDILSKKYFVSKAAMSIRLGVSFYYS